MSEKRYRELNGGEELEAGDEWAMPNRDLWTPIESRDVGEIAPYPHYRRFRRPISEPTDKDSFTVENGGEVGTPREWVVNYEGPIPQTEAFMLHIDDSEIDMGQVESKLSDFECERNCARDQVIALEKERDEWIQKYNQLLEKYEKVSKD